MTYEDWLDWKKNPVTVLFFDAAVERRNEVKEEVIQVAGQDSYQDAFKSGYCRAIDDFLNTEFTEVEDANATRA